MLQFVTRKGIKKVVLEIDREEVFHFAGVAKESYFIVILWG